ncbi:hypothetical protein ACSHXN_44635 (plasmid) [Streptomyces sp. HUAS TT11]
MRGAHPGLADALRRLARDYETRPATSEAAVQWSMAMLMGRRLARRRT